jgi:protein-S-isoprenylcysteine O-methyltransferase Ste14
MKRLAVLVFGVVVYAMFLGVFLYAVGFVGNFVVPTRLDGTAQSPVGRALAVDLALLALFAAQHSVMARPWFKAQWTRLVPQALERSTYVLCANLVLALLFWQWQPIGPAVWNVQHPWWRATLYGVFACGWLTVLVTTFLINHFDLFGLRQVWLYFRGRAYTPLGFVAPGPYRVVRHPMYVGWLIAFWATPTMTVGHLAFALGIAAYILTAIYFEERDLVRFLGQSYADYRKQVPMLIPRLRVRNERRQFRPTQPAALQTLTLDESTASFDRTSA